MTEDSENKEISDENNRKTVSKKDDGYCSFGNASLHSTVSGCGISKISSERQGEGSVAGPCQEVVSQRIVEASEVEEESESFGL